MKPRVIVHAGLNKTGSSSLQNALFLNRKQLAKQHVGYFCANIRIRSHFQLCDPLTYDFNVEKLLYTVKRQIKLGMETIILSCEGFHNAKNVKDAADSLRSIGCDCIFVLFVRDYFAYYRSWYQEVVKATRFSGSFHEFYTRFPKRLSNIIGGIRNSGECKLFVYHKYTIGTDDVVDLFCRYFEIKLDRNIQIEMQNPSTSGNLFLFKKYINQFAYEWDCNAMAGEVIALSSLDRTFAGTIDFDSQELIEFWPIYNKEMDYLNEILNINSFGEDGDWEEIRSLPYTQTMEFTLAHRRTADYQNILDYCYDNQFVMCSAIERSGLYPSGGGQASAIEEENKKLKLIITQMVVDDYDRRNSKKGRPFRFGSSA